MMRLARWAVVVAAASLVVTVAAVAYAAGQAKATKVLTADVVRAKRFEVVDDRGLLRASLALEGDGTLGVALWDREGTERLELSIDGSGDPALVLARRSGRPAATVAVREDGSPSVALWDERQVRSQLSVDAGRGAFLSMFDSSSQPRVQLEMQPDGTGGLTLTGSRGRPLGTFSVARATKCPGVAFYDAAGRERAGLAISPDGSLGLGLNDGNGKQRVGVGILPGGSPALVLYDSSEVPVWKAP